MIGGLDVTMYLGAVVALGVAIYVLLDGVDLGVGALVLFAREDEERDVMVNSSAPFWDGNETWLILGGALLFAAFPLAYSTLLPALYVPVVVMLFALIFRGVAFEFRFKARRARRLWDVAFAGGSVLAGFAQGVMLGAFIKGFEIRDFAFAGGPMDWFSAFGLLTGAAMVGGYALLGGAWLIWKTDGAAAALGRRGARIALPAVLASMALVSLLTPFHQPAVFERWFSFPNIFLLSPLPLTTGLVALLLWRTLADGRSETRPLALAVGLFLMGYAGLAATLWPYVVPRVYTLWDAASAPDSQKLMAWAVTIILPVILAYTIYAYWIFRGKTARGGGYH
jgi:cytochrome d ubiquinol oxidase subunit II